MTDPIQARTLAALTKARGFIVQGWTQKAYGRAPDGAGIGYATAGAHAWCMVGALYHAMPNEESLGIVLKAQLALEAAADTKKLIKFNDTPGRTKEEILAVYDRAIEALS